MRVLLDTCTFLWMALGDKALSQEAKRLFADPENDVFLSTISCWEIALKHSIKRLSLPDVPHRFIPVAREKLGVEILPLDEESALRTALVGRLHTDPFDHMLVTQALVHNLIILTPDEEIARYAVRTIW